MLTIWNRYSRLQSTLDHNDALQELYILECIANIGSPGLLHVVIQEVSKALILFHLGPFFPGWKSTMLTCHCANLLAHRW